VSGSVPARPPDTDVCLGRLLLPSVTRQLRWLGLGSVEYSLILAGKPRLRSWRPNGPKALHSPAAILLLTSEPVPHQQQYRSALLLPSPARFRPFRPALLAISTLSALGPRMTTAHLSASLRPFPARDVINTPHRGLISAPCLSYSSGPLEANFFFPRFRSVRTPCVNLLLLGRS
jgi:hypothetical protein